MKFLTKNEIVIGGLKIKVIEKEMDDFGESDLKNKTIYISKGLPSDLKELTVLHEILHLINPAFSEREVEYLSQALFSIYKNNF
jgi:Zn-dependent peptidase ImmA (M78 family)